VIPAWLRDLWKYGFTRSMRRQSRAAERYTNAILAFEAHVRTLPLAVARHDAAQALAATNLLDIRLAVGGLPATAAALGPAYREFFASHGRVGSADGSSFVDVLAIDVFDWAPGFLVVGQDDEHRHVMARPGDDAVYLVADDVPVEEMIEAQFPSVHHWVLALLRSEELLAAQDD
jgi:hypothetical protein